MYQTLVYAAGQAFACVESYDSLFERLRDAEFKLAGAEDTADMKWLPPLEVTVRGEYGPLRCLLQPHAISAVVELAEQDHVAVD